MTGSVQGGGPWMRVAIQHFASQYPDTFAFLEESVPDGHHITLICGRTPRPIGAVLMGPDGQEVVRVKPSYPTVTTACNAVFAAMRRVAA